MMRRYPGFSPGVTRKAARPGAGRIALLRASSMEAWLERVASPENCSVDIIITSNSRNSLSVGI